MPTVLLVDRDRDSLVIYSAFLEHHGYRVVPARSSAEGLSLARSETPDVVVTELYLSRLDGEALPARIKRDAATAHLPVVAVSALPPGLEPGWAACDSYLRKPCVPSRLLAEVERLLALPTTPRAG